MSRIEGCIDIPEAEVAASASENDHRFLGWAKVARRAPKFAVLAVGIAAATLTPSFIACGDSVGNFPAAMYTPLKPDSSLAIPKLDLGPDNTAFLSISGRDNNEDGILNYIDALDASERNRLDPRALTDANLDGKTDKQDPLALLPWVGLTNHPDNYDSNQDGALTCLDVQADVDAEGNVVQDSIPPEIQNIRWDNLANGVRVDAFRVRFAYSQNTNDIKKTLHTFGLTILDEKTRNAKQDKEFDVRVPANLLKEVGGSIVPIMRGVAQDESVKSIDWISEAKARYEPFGTAQHCDIKE